MTDFFFIVIAVLGWIGASVAITVDSVPMAIVATMLIYITRPEEYR